MVYLEKKIILPSMTYIVDLDAYDLHPGDEKSSKTLLMNAKLLHCTYERSSLLFKSTFVYLNLMIIYESHIIYIYIMSFVLLSLQLYVRNFTKKTFM